VTDDPTSSDSAAAVAPAAPSPAGSRLECLGLLARALLDVAALPFHLLAFVFTRNGYKRWLSEAMSVSSQEHEP